MNKRKILLIAMSLSIVAILAMGATLAYFTAEEEVSNTFVVGNIELDAWESKYDSTTNTLDTAEQVEENEGYVFIPGYTQPKDPTVKNIGNRNAYVRAKVVINISDISDGMFASVMTSPYQWFDTNDDWTWGNMWADPTTVDTDGDQYTMYYYYNQNGGIMTPNTQSTLFNSFTLEPTVDNAWADRVLSDDDDEFTIDVTFEAIQADSFENGTEAWAAFDGE